MEQMKVLKQEVAKDGDTIILYEGAKNLCWITLQNMRTAEKDAIYNSRLGQYGERHLPSASPGFLIVFIFYVIIRFTFCEINRWSN